VHRRKFLAASGTCLSVLAGCAGDTDGGSETTPPTSATSTTRNTPQTETATETTAAAAAPDSFVSRDGRHFTVDGEQFYFNGANCNYLVGWPYFDTAELEAVLRDASKMGLSVLRTGSLVNRSPSYWWAYSHQSVPGQFDEKAFAKLDYVIAKAREYGIRLVIPFVNAWGGRGGGVPQYVGWHVSADTYDDFYTDWRCRHTYRKFIKHVLNHENQYTNTKYKNDPTIMMWELGNELHLENHDDERLYKWIQDMAEHVKHFDSNHLLSTGAIGLGHYNGIEWGTDYLRDHSVDEIDACSFHLYGPAEVTGKGAFCNPESSRMDCQKSIQQHVQDAHNKLNKPAYIGEFGHPIHRTGDNVAKLKESRAEKYDKFYTELRKSDIDGAMFWQLHGVGKYPEDHYGEHPAPWAIRYPEDTAVVERVKQYSSTVAEKSETTSYA